MICFEIINRLKFEEIESNTLFSLKELLALTDLVKFAKAKPSTQKKIGTGIGAIAGYWASGRKRQK